MWDHHCTAAMPHSLQSMKSEEGWGALSLSLFLTQTNTHTHTVFTKETKVLVLRETKGFACLTQTQMGTMCVWMKHDCQTSNICMVNYCLVLILGRICVCWTDMCDSKNQYSAIRRTNAQTRAHRPLLQSFSCEDVTALTRQYSHHQQKREPRFKFTTSCILSLYVYCLKWQDEIKFITRSYIILSFLPRALNSCCS